MPVGLPLSIESSIHSDSFVDEKTYISAVIVFLNFSVRVRAADRLDASSSPARIALTGTSGLWRERLTVRISFSVSLHLRLRAERQSSE